LTCPSCGNENAASGVFCMRCGAPLQQSVGERPAPGAAIPRAGGSAPPAFAAVPEYAGFWVRFLAYLIDSIIVSVVMMIVVLPLSIVLGIALGVGQAAGGGALDEDAMGGVLALFLYPVIFGIMWLYQALLISSPRQATLGKMALGLIVTDRQGGRVSFGRASGRFFASLLSGLILNIGYLIQRPESHSLHHGKTVPAIRSHTPGRCASHSRPAASTSPASEGR